MGWFNKKEEKKEEMPSLPELPKLPEIPQINEEIPQINKEPPRINEEDIPSIHQLPSFPNSQLGQKFSQNTIKEAVTGRKEVEDAFDADDFAEEKTQTTLGHQEEDPLPEIDFPFKEDVEKKTAEVSESFGKTKHKIEKPIFIKLDKFEESIGIFEKIKKNVKEIEKMLEDTKEIKEKEEKELEEWERELKIIKGQIEKIDKNVFSKIE